MNILISISSASVSCDSDCWSALTATITPDKSGLVWKSSSSWNKRIEQESKEIEILSALQCSGLSWNLVLRMSRPSSPWWTRWVKPAPVCWQHARGGAEHATEGGHHEQDDEENADEELEDDEHVLDIGAEIIEQRIGLYGPLDVESNGGDFVSVHVGAVDSQLKIEVQGAPLIAEVRIPGRNIGIAKQWDKLPDIDCN